jgi:glycerol-3-phosphate dehydrogenase (NAD(P)+)
VKVAVVGGGSWGTAFAHLLAANGHEPILACRDSQQVSAINETGRNPRYLPEVDLRGVPAVALDDVRDSNAELVAIAVPSAVFRQVAASLDLDVPVIVLTKGLDPATGRRLSELISDRPVAVLSGPNHAEEISAGKPAAAVVASLDASTVAVVQSVAHSTAFRVYRNDDIIGVELCAASKNVMALAAGAGDGLELGDNAKAALISRGLAEMGRLAAASGARPETFAGLAGMGDLVATSWSRHSRNRRAGELIARGASPAQAAAEIGTVVEAITTAPVLRDLAQERNVDMPITEAVCDVLDGGLARELVSTLMARRPTTE